MELSYISESNFSSSKNKETSYISGKWNFIALKNLIKTPLGETGCLSNH